MTTAQLSAATGAIVDSFTTPAIITVMIEAPSPPPPLPPPPPFVNGTDTVAAPVTGVSSERTAIIAIAAGIVVTSAFVLIPFCFVIVLPRFSKKKKKKDKKGPVSPSKEESAKKEEPPPKPKPVEEEITVDVGKPQPLPAPTTVAVLQPDVELLKVEGIILWERLQLKARLIDYGQTGRLFRVKLDQRDEPLLVRRHAVNYMTLQTPKELAEEVNALRYCIHPHLMAIIGLATDGLRNYGTVMEYMPRSLSRELSEGSSKKLHASWDTISADIASALAYLHTNGFGHYALHPRNVFFNMSMTVKLGDYGRSPSVLRHQLNEEEEGQAAGAVPSPLIPEDEPRRLYCAPEVLQKQDRPLDVSADVWSLGCLMVRIASLKRLYSQVSGSTSVVMRRVASGELEPADQIEQRGEMLRGGPELVSLVQSCTKLEPSERPAIETVVAELKRIVTIRQVTRLLDTPASLSSPVQTPYNQVMMTPRDAFEAADADRDGLISAEELSTALSLLGMEMKSEGAVKVLQKYDASGTGALNIEPFGRVVRDLQRFQATRFVAVEDQATIERRQLEEREANLSSGGPVRRMDFQVEHAVEHHIDGFEEEKEAVSQEEVSLRSIQLASKALGGSMMATPPGRRRV